MRSIFIFFAFMYFSSCFPNVSLPNIFGDNMVLQRNAEVNIWGWAMPGEVVRINTSWGSEQLEAKANKRGVWEVLLSTPDIRGAQEISIEGYNKIVLNNVLLGEVWLVSGQSNMEWTAASGIDNAEAAIEGAENPNLRFFTVADRTAAYPQQDLEGSWVSSTPETMKHFSAAAYFFGKKINEELGVPVGLINSSWGGTPVEVWTPSEILKNDPQLAKAATLLRDEEWGPQEPGVIYNAMIAPLTPFKIAGVLWYQGETNTANADHYEDLFSALVKSWRQKWNEEFPLYFAQIAPFDYGDNFSGVKVRDAQRRSLKLPKTGMIMTSDIGNIKDIHPRNKMDVGLRFANLALQKTYGKNIAAEPPLLEDIDIDGKKVVVHFDNAEGLYLAPNNSQSQFEIAGEDLKFHPAKMKIKKNRVILRSDLVSDPEYVRYSWRNTSSSNLFNSSGLPASSFTTDIE